MYTVQELFSKLNNFLNFLEKVTKDDKKIYIKCIRDILILKAEPKYVRHKIWNADPLWSRMGSLIKNNLIKVNYYSNLLWISNNWGQLAPVYIRYVFNPFVNNFYVFLQIINFLHNL